VKTLTLSLSDAAASDILDQMDWYEQQADIRLGSRWERSVYLSLLRLVRYSHLGPLCSFKSVELRGIRRLPVAEFQKHLIFYRVESDRLVILRIVHGARDLESLSKIL
jgi:toxin ParE1/3/4